MCGLVGVFGNLYTKEINYFKDALVADSVRGFHSTGIATAEYDHKVKDYRYYFNKAAMTGAEAVLDPAMKDTYDCLQNYAIIGHNRWATQGAINADNAHPFHHKNIVLAHNGTLNTYAGLKGNFDTDSEHIAHTFSLEDSCILTTLETLNGAFALAWLDSQEGTINFARNSERPLFLCRNKSKDAAFFASEGKMLEWCADRNNISLETEPQALPVGEWWSFDLYDLGLNKEIKPERKSFTPRKKSWSYSTRSHGGNGNVSYLPKLPADVPKVNDMMDFMVTEITPCNDTDEYCTVDGWYFDEKGDYYNVSCFRVKTSKTIGMEEGSVVNGKVSSIAKTCTPAKFHIDTRTLILVGEEEETEKKPKKECSNCLQDAGEDYEEYNDGIVLCSDCDYMEGELGLCH